MAKIHTHYDNLKVARLAPQEVIRAAYKALSQKYHPDKNPGDEKAARIMAILNSAYGTLSDPVRRKEHDEWIAAEEWEIEWLESTRGDDKQRAEAHAWEPRPVDARGAYRATRDPAWWFGLGACFALGCMVGALALEQPKVLPVALAAVLNGKPAAEARLTPAAAARGDVLGEARADSGIDGWAIAKAPLPPSEVKALAVTQLVVPDRAPDCDTELHTLASPNGEPWPAKSGYVDGYPIGNQGGEMRVTVDNSANGSPVMVMIYDLDRRSNVRHAFVLAHDTLAIDKLSAGKYEVRYQNIDVGGSKGDCALRKKRGIRQAAAGQPGT